MEGIQVFRDDFDNMENRNAKCTELLGTFIEENGLSAHGNAGKFIDSIKPTGYCLGWDGNVYPKFRIVKIKIG